MLPGDWWVLNGIVTTLTVNTISKCPLARQVNETLWVFPQEVMDLSKTDVGSISDHYLRDPRIISLFTLIFHARYVDNKDKDRAHLMLNTSGVVTCIKAITSRKTEVLLCSSVPDNIAKVNKQAMNKFREFIKFMADQSQMNYEIITTSENMPAAIVESLEKSRDAFKTLKWYYSKFKHLFHNVTDILNRANQEQDHFTRYLTAEKKAECEDILPLMLLLVELCSRFLHLDDNNDKYSQRNLYDFNVRNNQPVSTKSMTDVTLVDYYTSFTSVKNYFLFSTEGVLNMRDKLAVRINEFMLNSYYFIFSDEKLSSYIAYDNFHSDFEYLIDTCTMYEELESDLQKKVCYFYFFSLHN